MAAYRAVNIRIAHRVVAKILEDLIVDGQIDAAIPIEYPNEQALEIAKEIQEIMNWHVAQSKTSGRKPPSIEEMSGSIDFGGPVDYTRLGE